jgi:methionyl-tRNA formyltransferase
VRLAYFGTSAFAVPALQRLSAHVALVVTQPDRPTGRGLEARPTEVKSAALQLGLPVETPERSRDKAFVERLRALDADAFVVASYGQILSKSLLAVPRQGCFNLHASLLPKYRGAAPIQYALLNGDRETGVTLMRMDAGMDTGDIVAATKTEVRPNETAGELHDRLALLAADLIEEWIGRLTIGDYPRTPQESSSATYAPKVTKADAELSFDRPAAKEHDRYRAFTPYPGAWISTCAGTLKVKRATPGGRHSVGAPDSGLDADPDASPGGRRSVGAPGTVLSTSPLEVAFSPGSLVFETVQLEGRKPVSGAEFANGARLEPGDCLKPVESRP